MAATTIQQAKAQLGSQRQQLEQQKTKIAEAKSKAQKSQEQLLKAKQSLPEVQSQRALRQKMSGLQGRETRRKVLGVKKSLTGKEKEVERYKKEVLAPAEKELTQVETQLTQAEAQVREEEQEQQAFKIAQDLVEKGEQGVFVFPRGDSRVKKYYDQIISSKQKAKELQEQLAKGEIPSNLQARLDNLAKKGITGKKAWNDLGFEVKTLESVNVDLPRGEKIDITDIKGISQRGVTDLSKINLKSSNVSKQNGLGSITGASISEDISVGGKQSIRTRVGNGFSRVRDTFKEDISKDKKEKYVSGLGFVSAAQGVPEISKSTLNIRQPTQTELKKIEEAQYKGSLKGITDIVVSKGRTIKAYDPILMRGTTQTGIGGEPILYKDVTIPDTTVGDVLSAPSNIAEGISKGVGGTAEVVSRGIFKQVAPSGKRVSPRYYGEKLGNIIKHPSTIFEFVERRVGGKEKPKVVYDITGGVVRETTKEDLLKPDLINVLPEKYLLKTKDISKGIGSIVSFGTELGIYAIPYVGGVVFASQTEKELRPYEYNVLEFGKEKPLEAGILGTVALGIGASKLKRLYKTPLITKTGEEISVTTKGKNIFGKRLSVDFKRGESFLKSKLRFNILPEAGKLTIKKQKIGIGQLVESAKPVKPTTLSLSDEATYKLLEEYITPIKNTKGFTRAITEGEKKIVTKELPQRISVGLKGVKFLPSEEKVIFKGLSPFTKAGKIERANVLREFKNLGLTSKYGKSLISLRQPKIEEYKSDITGFTIESEKGKRLLLKEVEIKNMKKEPFTDIFGRVTSRGGKQVKKIKTLELVPSGKTTKEGEEIYSGILVEYNPAGKLGKRTETFKVSSVAKKIGERELGVNAITVENIGKVSKPSTFEFYKSGGVSQKVIPKQRLVSTSTGNLIVKKPSQREVVDLDEYLGVSKVTSTFIKPSGKKSSQGFTQELYAPSEKISPTGLSILQESKSSGIKPPRKTPNPKIEVSSKVGEGIPTYLGGAGVVGESKYAGTGQYEVQEVSATFVPSITGNSIMDTTRVSTSTNVNQQQTQISMSKLSSKLDLKQRQIPQLKLDTFSRMETKEVQKPKQEVTPLTGLGTLQLLKQTTTQITQTPQPRPPTSQRPKPKSEKTIKPKGFIFPAKKVTAKQKVKEAAQDLFTAFVTKAGKDVKLGEFETLGEAKKKVKEELLTTLRAGARITKEGKQIRFNLGTGFRPSKINPFKIVQEKTRRFGSKSETSEAQFFRKVRKGKNKNRWV